MCKLFCKFNQLYRKRPKRDVEVESGDRIETKFGEVEFVEVKSGKITVILDDDISATFSLGEFVEDLIVQP